jgi:hypothetical protein
MNNSYSRINTGAQCKHQVAIRIPALVLASSFSKFQRQLYLYKLLLSEKDSKNRHQEMGGRRAGEFTFHRVIFLGTEGGGHSTDSGSILHRGASRHVDEPSEDMPGGTSHPH